MDDLQSIVDAMLPEIEGRLNIAPSTFRLWFGEFKLISLDDKKATFTTINDLRRGILVNKYLDVIKEELSNVIGFTVDIDILVAKDLEPKDEEDEEEERPLTPEEERENREREEKIRMILSEKIDENSSKLDEYTFLNFIEGASNKFAKKACEAVANSFPAYDYNPLFIYGNSGLGKTHLLCAVINHMKIKFPRLKIVYKKCEEFLNELVASISSYSMDEFKEKYRGADVLLIDDIQFIAGKEATQEEFFHTFSYLYEANKTIILTSDRPPHEIKPLEDRLRTRFEGGLIADIQPPSPELRTAIIKNKSEMYNLDISNELVDYMSERLHENIRQIEGVIKKMNLLVNIQHAEVSKLLIDQCITAIDPGNIPTDILIERILKAVSNYFSLPIEALKSKRKTNTVAGARHIAIYVIKNLTEKSYQDIADIFNRDRTTVMASCNKIEIEMKTMKSTERAVKKIIKDVKGP